MRILTACLWFLLHASTVSAAAPNYTIEAIRYGTIIQFPLSGLLAGGREDEGIDIPLMFWLIRGEGKNILFDAGFHRESWFDQFPIEDYTRPDDAVRAAGVEPEAIQDIVISHAHWDHVGGIDLFPNATVYMQKDEFAYYTGPAWQDGGRSGGIDPQDLLYLLDLNTRGRLRLIDGDDQEILPGVRGFVGARHTYASQYIRIEGDPPFVLASDNCYLYRNLETRSAIPTFDAADRDANLKELDRMVRLAGAAERVVPGHDPFVFEKFRTSGRIARIR